MKLSDLTNDRLMDVYEDGKPIMMISGPGLGKTELVTQFCEQASLGLVPFHVTSIDSVDVRGFCIPQKSETGPEAVFTKSPILTAIHATGLERGILFLDELLQGDQLVLKALAPLLSEGRLGSELIPPGWRVWAASNRVSDRAGVNRPPSHLTNRIRLLHLTGCVKGWTRWANANGVHPMVIAFVNARPGIVFSDDPPKKPDEPFPTARSVTMAGRFLARNANGMELPSDPVTQEMIQGDIGEGAAAELFSFIKVVNEIPKIEEIIADPHDCKLPKMQRLDAQYAAMQLCIHHAEASNIDPLFTYVCRLNKELQTSAAQQLIARGGGTLLNSPALTKWIAANKSLIHSTLG